MTDLPDRAALNVRAVKRAMAVLKSFSGKSAQSLAEVTVATGLDKGTTRRLLVTLLHDGFVVQHHATQRYSLGPAIRTLAANVVDSVDIKELAAPIMTRLAADLQLTVFLSAYREGQAICLNRCHDISGVEVRWWAIGGVLPLNCGAAPKLLLAYQSDEEIDRAARGPLTALTTKSTTDAESLMKQLRQIRRRGWSLSVDDVALGLAALAVPVFGQDGNLVCSISLGGMTAQLIDRGKPLQLERLRVAAQSLQTALGAQVDSPIAFPPKGRDQPGRDPDRAVHR